MENLSSFLSFEIKKEIADRYFGFRKAIEEDTSRYHKNIHKSSLDLENNIGIDLVRIFTLLENEPLIDSFFKLTNLPDKPFLDSHLNKSKKVRLEIFKNQTLRGLTKKSCFKNMLFDTYKLLYHHIGDYQTTFNKLVEDQQTIEEQITIFYKKNDISTILQFLHGLDTNSQSQFCLLPDNTRNLTQGLDDKLRLSPPPSVAELLPAFPSIPPFKSIRSHLKKLAHDAQTLRPDYDIRK